MRILMVSKFRTFQGGVESHIDDLMSGLQDLGNEVQLFSSEDIEGGSGFDVNARGLISQAHSAASLLWSSRSRKSLKDTILHFKPDLIHYHSIYHQLSPSVLDVDKIPAIMTLHDYKMVAPCYSLYRDADICTDCVGLAVPFPAIRHKCVKNSVLASAVCSIEQVFFRSRYRNNVKRFIVPSKYLFEKLTSSGFDHEQLTVVPWGVPESDVRTVDSPLETGSEYFLYAGRLHESKGIADLLMAWARLPLKTGFRLLVAGGGPLAKSVQTAAVADPRIEYLGVLDRVRLLDLVSQAAATIVPSKVPETMGLSALESMSMGTPVISTRRGALSDLAGGGVIVVDAENLVIDLTRVLSLCVSDPDFLRLERAGLEQRDTSQYTRESMVRKIVAVSAEVLDLGSDGLTV